METDFDTLDRDSLRQALQYLFYTCSPLEALTACGYLPSLIDLYRDWTGNNRFGWFSDKSEIAQALLNDVYELPILVESIVPEPDAATMEIHEHQEALVRAVERREQDSDAWRGPSLSAWAQVENMLKWSLVFCVRHFSQDVPRHIMDCFSKAAKEKSIGPIVHAFLDVERIFHYGEPSDMRKKRYRRFNEQR